MDKEIKEEVIDKGAEEAPVTPVKRKRGRPRLLNNEVNVKTVIDAINSTGGRIYETCKLCSMSVSEFYKRFRYNKKIEEALIKSRQVGFELVTDTLLDKAMNGDMRAIQTYLRYNPIAKMNEWTDHQTLTIKEDKPLTDEEKQDLAKKLFGN
jgi:hypothetical protein